MSNTTIAALSKMMLSFGDTTLEKFYQNLSHSSPEFKAQCVDKIVGLFVKVEKLFEKHRTLEALYKKLEKRRSDSEKHYRAWEQQHQNAKSLQELIESDLKMNQLFKRLVELSTTNQFVGQESVDLLIQAEKELDQKIADLHQEQIALDKNYVQQSWHTHRRLARILREIGKHLPLKDVYQRESNIFETAAEKIVFKLSELFFSSTKKTPTGFQYITLDNFIKAGVVKINEYFTVNSFALIKSYAQEVLAELYQELLEFHGSFQGTQQEIDRSFTQREAMGKTLSDKLSKLKELVSEYSSQLDHVSHAAEATERYTAEANKILKTPKPPPTLKPG